MEASFYSGHATKWLSQALVDGCVFPLVRVLTICIAPDKIDEVDRSSVHYLDGAIDPKTVDGNINACVQLVKEMMPMLNEVRLEFERGLRLSGHIRRYTNRLISQLFRLANRIEYIDPGEEAVLLTLEVDGIRQLTHIRCNYMDAADCFVLLARLNARTLQSLNLGVNLKRPTSILIRNDNDSHVAYSQLVTLSLPWWTSGEVPQRPVFSSGVVPFPSLRSVDLPDSYPFGDDTLFRGNAATLERLSMKLHGPTVDMLRRYRVFTQASHPKLWYVNISYDNELIPGTFATVDEIMHFSLSIGPGASVRALRSYMEINKLEMDVSLLGRHSNIQILTLAHTRPDLWNVIALIKALPLLSDLHSLPPWLGALPAGITTNELPAYAIATYAPVGGRFRGWHFRGFTGIGGQVDIVTCVMLLALVCPSFGYLVTDNLNGGYFKPEAERFIDSNMFKQYSPRLKSLAIYIRDRRLS